MLLTLAFAASLAVTPTSPEPVFGIKPEIMTLETLALRLSQPGIEVRCAKSLATRHGLIAIQPKEWPDVRKTLEAGLSIKFNALREGVWEMVPDSAAAARDKALQATYFRVADQRISDLLRRAFNQLPKPTLEAAQRVSAQAQDELNMARGGDDSHDTDLIRSLTEARDLTASINGPAEWRLAQLQLSQPYVRTFSAAGSRILLTTMSEAARLMGYGDRSEIDPGNFNLNWILEATHYSITAWADLESGEVMGVGVPLTELGCYRPTAAGLGPSFRMHRSSPWDLLDKPAQQAHDANVAKTTDFLKSDLARRKVRLEKGSRVSVLTILKALAEQEKIDVVAECPPVMELGGTFVMSDFRMVSLHELLGPLLLEGRTSLLGPIPGLLGEYAQRLLETVRGEELRANSIALGIQDGVILGRDELGWLRRTADPPVYALARWEEEVVVGRKGPAASLTLAEVLSLVRAASPQQNADWFRLPVELTSPTGLRLSEFAQSMPFWAVLANMPVDQAEQVVRSVAESGEVQVPFQSLPAQARNAFLTHCEALPTLTHIARHPNLRGILAGAVISFGRQSLSTETPDVIHLTFAFYPKGGLQPAGQALAIEYGGVPLSVEKQ